MSDFIKISCNSLFIAVCASREAANAHVQWAQRNNYSKIELIESRQWPEVIVCNDDCTPAAQPDPFFTVIATK